MTSLTRFGWIVPSALTALASVALVAACGSAAETRGRPESSGGRITAPLTVAPTSTTLGSATTWVEAPFSAPVEHPLTTTAEPATTVPTPTTAGAAAKDPLVVTDADLAARLSSTRIGRLDRSIRLGSAMLTPPPASSPGVSVDQAYLATQPNGIVSRYFGQPSTSLDVVLALYGSDAGDPDRPAELVYDFMTNGAMCAASAATTAAPDAAPQPPTLCTVHVLVDADDGSVLLSAEAWS